MSVNQLHIASGCLNKRVIQNCYGASLLVDCGHCVYCQNRSLNKLYSLTEAERYFSKFCAFVTLTFNNDNVPLFRFELTKRIADNCTEVNNHLTYDVQSYSRPVFMVNVRHPHKQGNFLVGSSALSAGASFRDFTHKAYSLCRDSKGNAITLNGKLAFPYLDSSILQLFIKRLRKSLSKYDSERSIKNIRFLAVGEYGSHTLRPHYHLLLFFNSKFILYNLQRLIRKNWQFGDVDYQLAQNASSYVSSYLASNSTLPQFITSSTSYIKPFRRHSNYFGCFQTPYLFLSKVSNSFFPPSVDYFFKKTRTIQLSWSSLRSVFPKIPFSFPHSSESTLQLLQTFARKDVLDFILSCPISRLSKSIYRSFCLNSDSLPFRYTFYNLCRFLGVSSSSDLNDRLRFIGRISLFLSYVSKLPKIFNFSSKLFHRLYGFNFDSFTDFKHIYMLISNRIDFVQLSNFFTQLSSVSSTPYANYQPYMYVNGDFHPLSSVKDNTLQYIFYNQDFNNLLNRDKSKKLNSKFNLI